MMTKQNDLVEQLRQAFGNSLLSIEEAYHEVTVEIAAERVINVLLQLRDNSAFGFNQLVDVCAVDYLLYGQYDWETESATDKGFSRGVERAECQAYYLDKPRFAVVYHLLSTVKNHRLRVKVFLDEDNLIIPSVHSIWKSADWFEREAYDLYGILFEGHPDLRRILTDYGFIGHPFRKDFPLIGQVEMRYDAKLKKVIYEPVEIKSRTSVPKVIRTDNRYLDLEKPHHD